MAIEVKRRRGTTAQMAVFTGAEGEIAVDTDKEVVVVHDGITPGGFPGARADQVVSGNYLSSFQGSSGSISLVAGANITLNTGVRSITIVGATVGATGVTSLNGSTGSLSISAGAGIGIGQANSTMTISASNQSALVSISTVAGGATSGTANTASSSAFQFVAGSNITLSQLSTNPSITIIGASGGAGAAGTQTLSVGAASVTGTAVSLALVAGNNITLGTASAAGALTVSITGAALATGVTSLNGSTGSLSISAGAGIGIGQANSTITISASAQTVQPVWLSGSSIAGGAFNGATATASASTLSIIAGSGITISQNSSNAITISGNTTVASANVVSGFGTGAATSTGTIVLAAGANITLNTGAGSITIVGGAGGAGGTQTLSAGAASVTGSAVSLALVAGNNITLGTASAAGALTVSITGVAAATGVTSLNASTGSLSISAGAGIGIGQANSTITISASNQTANLPARVSYTQNFPINQASPVTIGTLTATGTVGASSSNNPFGSSFSLQRMYLPAPMALSEVDLAFGISFPATNQGQGSMSQTLVVYSFGNSTSLATLLSASRAVSWASGTTTSGTSSSLQQGWASNNVQPFTFASTSISAGEYAVGHLLSWAAQSTSWTLSVYGNAAQNSQSSATGQVLTSLATSTQALTAFTAAPTSLSANSFVALAGSGITGVNAGSVVTGTVAGSIATLTAAGTRVTNISAGSGVTAVNSYGSAFVAGSMLSAVSSMSISAAVVMSSSSTGTLAAVISLSSTGTQKTATVGVNYVSSNSNIVSGIGAQAGSVIVGTLSNVEITGTAAGSAITGMLAGSGITGVQAGSIITASGSVAGLSNAGTASVSPLTNLSQSTFAVTSVTYGTPSFNYNGSLAMTTNTTQASYWSGYFNQGIMATGSSAASIDLKSTAVTVTGSLALIQPWFALAGT